MRSALLVVAAWACGPALAQNPTRPATPEARPPAPAPSPAVPCPADAQALPLAALFGRWEARFDGIPGIATLELARHPDYAGVRGQVRRADGSTAELAGDIDDEGSLVVDESQDGRTISATWSGTLQAASCGAVFEGTWRRAGDDATTRFTLRKLPSGGDEGNNRQ